MRLSRELRVAWLLLLKSTLRHWRMAWGNYLVLLAIIAVGVGAFNGIRQASRAASANFGLFNEAVSGRSDFLLERAPGQLSDADLSALAELASDPDWHVVPVIEGGLTQLDAQGAQLRQLHMVGLDLVSLGNLPRFVEQGFSLGDSEDEWYDWLGPLDVVWISYTLAEVAGLERGDRLEVVTGGVAKTLQIADVIGDAQSGLPDDLILCDLPAAQAILGRPRQLDRIELVVADRGQRADPKYLAVLEKRIQAVLPAAYTVLPAEARAAERASMTEAFRMNLMILSLIAILVGVYLILQALDAAVVRRRSELATLRSLGVSAVSLFAMCLFEALLLGVLGSFLGIGVGYLLALGAVHSLADTVNAIYFATSAEQIQLTAADWWIGMVLGTLFSLLAGWLPARDAMLTPPAQVLVREDWSPGFVWLRRPRLGLGFLLLGALALLLPPPVMAGGAQMALGGFLAAGCWIFGAALLSGQALVVLAKALRHCSPSAVWRLALSRLADGSSRHRLAVAGLVVAVAMVTGIFQMVGSFRTTIEEWFDVRFQAGLYISEQGSSGHRANGIRLEVLQSLQALPELDYLDALYTTQVDAPVGVTVLAGVDFDVWETHDLKQIWIQPPGDWQAPAGAEPAYVSEAFARRFDVMQGGVVELQTPMGPRAVSPIAIFADYGNEFGSAVVDVPVWREWTGLERPLNVSLYLQPGEDLNVVRDRLRIEFPGLKVNNAQELRRLALGIFDQTFRVTGALNLIGIVVAMVGLLLGLIAIFEESTRTWLTLNHLGFGRRRLLLTAGLEGAGIALAAWISGTAVGLALGWLLIAVINVQSFGWTLLWRIPYGSLLLFGALLMVAGYVCGLCAGALWYRRNSRK
ncbi:MAG: putative ABC transport system permease protein [Lentimonas sp.]|jgi:putative ABC transport system permease protein